MNIETDFSLLIFLKLLFIDISKADNIRFSKYINPKIDTLLDLSIFLQLSIHKGGEQGFP